MSKMEIGKTCLESYPCQHKVKINGVDKGTWDGVRIYQWHKDNGQAVPEHFRQYANPWNTDLPDSKK